MSEKDQKQDAEAVTTPSEQEQEQIVGGSVIPTRQRPRLEADPSHFDARALNTKFDPGGPPARMRK